MNETETHAQASPALDDPRVVAALEEYMSAVERGSRPSREEFLSRHADVADVLAACLDGVEMLRGLEYSADAAGERTPGTLGDFRILREVGRGGMGVVYEAEQISLGRRVALKVLPFAATMDPRHLQRFQNEAHAAAQLHHTNIVPVYSVGCERGVHYYAMQFIEGHSLAEMVTQFRSQRDSAVREASPSSPLTDATVDAPAGQAIARASGSGAAVPTQPIAALSTVRSTQDTAYFRTVAQLGIQVAEALDFAHERGILH
ncbi:MAG TPA: protein kinase, partial [Gemmataceae bacterium]|nr:protein kinase [Gemmataceae bacterium]